MKIAVALLAATLSLAALAAGAQPAPRHMMEDTPPPAMAGPAISVPITFTAAMPTIEVTVNGKGPLRLGFDTGAMGGVHISAAAADRAGLQPMGEAMASDPSGRNPQRIKLYGSSEYGLGGRSFTAMTTESPAMAGGKLAALDGIAGLGLFGGGLVTIDYGKGLLSVAPGALPPPDGRTVFAYQGGIPRLPVQVEGRTVEAHLDTGNVRAALILPLEVADQLSGRAAATEAGVAHTVSSAIPMFAMKLSSAPRIGETTLAVSEAQFPSVISLANVGSLALQGLIVRIDTLNRRVQVLSPPTVGRSS
ncbi:MAG: hypothetical protein JWP50_1830 [Phenylobacterium sp.]|nr:hypothetical protein [Phenylobacterium sp.]